MCVGERERERERESAASGFVVERKSEKDEVLEMPKNGLERLRV